MYYVYGKHVYENFGHSKTFVKTYPNLGHTKEEDNLSAKYNTACPNVSVVFRGSTVSCAVILSGFSIESGLFFIYTSSV